MKPLPADSELRRLQRAFTEHLRNPEAVPIPNGLDPRRMGVYKDLIFGNLSSLLADFFPVIHNILTESEWNQLVRDFFICHQAETPYFPKIAEEYVSYLSERQLSSAEPDFIPELAHYEWVELALYTSEAEAPEMNLTEAELTDSPLALSPLAAPLVYAYPVHKISPDYLPEGPGNQPTCLLVFRDREDNVRFFELQPLAYKLLESLSDNPGLITREWLTTAAAEASIEDPTDFISGGFSLLSQFNDHGLLLKQQ